MNQDLSPPSPRPSAEGQGSSQDILASLPTKSAAAERAGAARFEDDEGEGVGEALASEAASFGEMPLIVWLRGDEPWCDSFSLEAEDVMRQLAIKRSRLTQISGRELRVGRIRRGRYIVPLYRPSDVEAYLAWTRSPATHRQAAAALDVAGEKLSEAGERMAGELGSRVEQLLEKLVDRSVAATSVASTQLEAKLQSALAGLRQTQAALQRQQTAGFELSSRAARMQAEELTRLCEAEAVAATTLGSLATDVRELLVASRSARQEVGTALEEVGEKLDSLEVRVNSRLETFDMRLDQLEHELNARLDAVGSFCDTLDARMDSWHAQQLVGPVLLDRDTASRHFDELSASLDSLPEILEVHATRLLMRGVHKDRCKSRRLAQVRRTAAKTI